MYNSINRSKCPRSRSKSSLAGAVPPRHHQANPSRHPILSPHRHCFRLLSKPTRIWVNTLRPPQTKRTLRQTVTPPLLPAQHLHQTQSPPTHHTTPPLKPSPLLEPATPAATRLQVLAGTSLCVSGWWTRGPWTRERYRRGSTRDTGRV